MKTPSTLVEMFNNRVASSGDAAALWTKHDGEFRAISWNTLGDRVRKLAAALVKQGVNPGDRVIQISENRGEWIEVDLAIQMTQAIHVPVHAPLTAEQVLYQIEHSGANVVFVSNEAQFAKLQAVEKQLPPEITLISYDALAASLAGQSLRTLEDFLKSSNDEEGQAVADAALASLTEESVATILYTSGTTGMPKGVVLTQRNLVTNTYATLSTMGFRDDDVRLTFLPLSHVFARTCDLYSWIALGHELALAEARETVIADCAAIRPTLLNGVPYFFDRVRRLLIEAGQGENPEALAGIFGGRIRYFCGGGAALPEHVYDFYLERGVPILQGYGLTETSPVISVSSETHHRRGASGRPIPDIEVRIADDGEILTRGPHVMVGYYQQPEATAEVLQDGWFATGDLGHLDADDFLFITGRKKEIIVTSGGKNISPVLLESLLTEETLFAQALIVGDDRKFLTALLVPDPEEFQALLRSENLDGMGPDEAAQHPRLLAAIEAKVTHQLRTVSQYEQVRKFTLLSRAFSIESGELTPKLTLRRKVIESNFAAEIEAMYAD